MRAKPPQHRPLVFIGIPCYGTVSPEVYEDGLRFAYHLGRRMPEIDVLLGIRTKSEQFRARNQIVDAARQANADWLLMLDDDMVLNPYVTSGPTEDYDVLRRLMAHDKDLCGVLYYQRVGSCSPVLMTKASDIGYRFLRDDEVTHGLQRVDVAGGGCLLIKMRVFDHISPPFFAPEFQWGTDVQLCRKAAEKGYEVWADTSIELGHVRDERVIVTSRNRRQFTLTDTVPGEVKRAFVAADLYSALIADGCAYTKYPHIDAMVRAGNAFLDQRKASGLPDAEWYQEFPRERVARQIAYNTQTPGKRLMTEHILQSIGHQQSLKILDFGCGIGVTAYALAERGHRVTAMDLAGTGTIAFLRWRAAEHGVPITFVASPGGVPDLGSEVYDVIVAMDSIEHIAEWRDVVKTLGAHLRDGGFLFSNNAILEDKLHPEHYDIDNTEFIKVCLDASLRPVNEICYVKKAAVPAVAREVAHA